MGKSPFLSYCYRDQLAHVFVFVLRVPTDTYVFSGLPHGFRETGKLEANEMWDRVMSNGITWALSEPSAGAWEIKTK